MKSMHPLSTYIYTNKIVALSWNDALQMATIVA